MNAMPTLELPRSPLAWVPFVFQRFLFSAAPDGFTRIRPLSLLFIVLLPALLLYPTRSFHLLEPDEGRYAQIPKEMLERGSWIVPTLQGQAYLDKPPLMYWLIATSYSIFGVNEAAARLIPAMCVHATILLVYLLGRRSIGERGAFWAAVLLTVSPGYLGVARLLLLDGLLTLCVTASFLCGFEAVRTAKLLRGWWIAAAICSGLGFLTKGPISEVLLFPPLVAFAWLTQSTLRIGWRQCLLFAAIVIGVNLPWYIAIYVKQPEFLKHFFWEHNIMRFVKPFDHLEPVWYYVPILLLGFLPGVVFLVPYLVGMLRGHKEAMEARSPAGGFWLLAGLWCVAFFSFSGSKLPTYILPAFPPLCLALGEFIARTKWDTRTSTRAVMLAFALFLGFVHGVALPWYARVRSPMAQQELVAKYVSDPNVVVVTHPRNCDSVAFYTNRSDFKQVRSKDLNQMIVDSHFRPKTVVLLTHNHSLEAFREILRTAMGSTVGIVDEVDLNTKPTGNKLLDKLTAGGPWGLCDIAVIAPGQRK